MAEDQAPMRARAHVGRMLAPSDAARRSGQHLGGRPRTSDARSCCAEDSAPRTAAARR